MKLRRFFLCSGVHGSRDSLDWLTGAVVRQSPDALLFAGGILAPSRHAVTGSTPWSLNKDDYRFIEEFFAVLGSSGAFTALIPGPAGVPLEEFFRLGVELELVHPNVHVAHATVIEEDDLAVCGFGGPIGEQKLIGIDSASRPTVEYALRPLWNVNKPRKVLLLPVPPPGPLGGDEGVPLVAEIVDSFHPNLCVVAGRAACRGSAQVGHTLIVNPGCLADGSATWLDWEQDEVTFLDVRDSAAPSAPKARPGPRPQPRPITEDEIRRRAYLRWEWAGKPEGASTRFWQEAEEELRREAEGHPWSGERSA